MKKFAVMFKKFRRMFKMFKRVYSLCPNTNPCKRNYIILTN